MVLRAGVGIAVVLTAMGVAGCSSGGGAQSTGVYVARIGDRWHADGRIRRANSEEARRVPVEYTLVGSFCAQTEFRSRPEPTHAARTVTRKGKTLFVKRPGLARVEPIARGVTYHEWSPTGRTLAFVRTHEYIDRAIGVTTPDWEALRLVNADGTGLRSYGRWASIDSIAWSPDARRIALSTSSGIWLVEADHRGRHRVTRPGYVFKDICPIWLDGQTIAFYRDLPNALP